MVNEVEQNVALTQFNTFGVQARAKEFLRIRSVDDISDIIRNTNSEPWVLGGGSNILLTRDLDYLVLKNEIESIQTLEETQTEVILRVGGGVNWHGLVLWAVDRNLGGIENLALIPGRVGAAPIQNIGAYGVELKDVFVRLECIDLTTGRSSEFNSGDCEFGYRNSVFKNRYKGKYCITHVIIRLTKNNHAIRTDYGAIKSILERSEISDPSIKNICNTVIKIRSSKLPNPEELGNSGSFFKNPVISSSEWQSVLSEHPDLVHYELPNGEYKIPAGWLIEQCGWKGKRVGNVGCYSKQALVIVNYGGATGQEIWDHALRVQKSVLDTFGIELTPEVNVL